MAGGRWRERVERLGRVLTPRLPPAAFGVVALGLAASGWLRPPLSPDVSGFHITLSPGPAGPDSIGLLLTSLLGVGVLVVMWRPAPARLGAVAGLVLAAILAATAAVVLNHPALIECLDREQEQREHIAHVIRASPEPGSLTRPGNGRVQSAPDDGGPEGPTHGLAYLHRGPWLVAWAALGVLLASPGSTGRRLGSVLGWSLVGIAASAVVCAPRLHAEYYWGRAVRAEAAGDRPAADAALDRAVEVFPEFARLERTWLLAGKLDHFVGRTTPQERFFRVARLAAREQWPQAVALVRELRAGPAGDQPAVRAQTARVYAAVGLDYYARAASFTDAGANSTRQDRNLTAAVTAWEQGLEADPRHRGCAISLGLAQARLTPDRPDLVEARLVPEVGATADQVIRADLLATIGVVRFRAGDVTAARVRYAESFAAFNLPTVINYRAQKGLGGW